MTVPASRCPGTVNRRAFLRAGATVLGGLSLGNLLRLEAQTQRSSPKSVIVLWLWGGASHMETFDL